MAPVWRNSFLSKSSGSNSCPTSLLPMLGAACRSCRQERTLTSLSLWKLSSLRFKLPFSLPFQGPSGSAPADGQHKRGDSSIAEASICRGFECASWTQSKCQPAWEGFQPQMSSGQMAKVFFSAWRKLSLWNMPRETCTYGSFSCRRLHVHNPPSRTSVTDSWEVTIIILSLDAEQHSALVCLGEERKSVCKRLVA